MKINSKQERYRYLESVIGNEMGAYFLVTYENHTEPIWITKYSNWDADGDWFLEAPCICRRYEFKDTSEKAIRKYAEELYESNYIEEGIKYTKSMIKDGWLYDIDCPQVSPFLPDVLDNLTVISEQECLDYMIKNSK